MQRTDPEEGWGAYNHIKNRNATVHVNALVFINFQRKKLSYRTSEKKSGGPLAPAISGILKGTGTVLCENGGGGGQR
jgi:hypothetical protein